MSDCAIVGSDEKSVLTKADVARLAKVSRRLVDTGMKDGRLVPRVISGRTWITRESANAFADWLGGK